MKNLTYSDAKSIATEYLRCQKLGCELVILEKETLEREFGWVFFYNTKKYQETGDFRDMLGGNAPVIIDRNTGKLTETGTAFDIEHYIDVYNQEERGWYSQMGSG